MTEGWKNGASSPWQDPYAYSSYADTVAAGIPQHQIKGYLVYELPFGKGENGCPTPAPWLIWRVGGSWEPW